ncbi:MAG: hypothetical protein WAX38_04425 [Minisyncoccia bacterium]
MIGPQLIIVGIVGGLIVISLVEYAKTKCKKDLCIFYIIIAIVVTLIFTFTLAILG